MTKKHFIEVARGFNHLLKTTKEYNQDGIWMAIGMMIAIFENNNPEFNEEKFLQAVKKDL